MSTNSGKKVCVVGGGPVGCLAALMLARRGHQVEIHESRPDSRSPSTQHRGRSINLALSDRGLLALEHVGLADTLRQAGIPMYGRMIHTPDGKVTYSPYGAPGQHILSVSRRLLNETVLTAAENHSGVKVYFEHKGVSFDLTRGDAIFEKSGEQEKVKVMGCDWILGADGAYSGVRKAMMRETRMNYSQQYIEHGYKELVIPAGSPLEMHALHIWPRGEFMMIALPNPGGDFTCTLFAPFALFESLDKGGPQAVRRFFEATFADAVPQMPTLEHDYADNPTSPLMIVKCEPYHYGRGLLIGDAAHAVVPFYGQGCNAGFEDCRILEAILAATHDDFGQAAPQYTLERKANCDALADLALDNYYVMRKKTASWWFNQRLRLERLLHKVAPQTWTPLYTMVTFSPHLGYAEARERAAKQDRVMDGVVTGIKWTVASSALGVGLVAAVKSGVAHKVVDALWGSK